MNISLQSIYQRLLGGAFLWLYASQPIVAQQPASTQRVSLDIPLLRKQLTAAPASGSRPTSSSSYRLRLPTLRGTRAFVLTETYILPAADTAAQRRLRTFVGVEEGEETHHVAVVLTPREFTAQLLAGEESASLRPATDSTGGYLLQPTPATQGPCGTQAPTGALRPNNSSTQPAPFNFGTQLRRLNYAILVTKEYYNANGNADAAVEQAVVGAMNQMSVLYSTDLSTSYQLVKPLGSTYYFSAMTTPTLPGNGGAITGQLRYQNLGDVGDLINTRFDLNGFDLGHCFHLDGGGIATLGIICNNTYKARGWSGVSTSGFQQVLAHEMGHQHGATHTFNGPCGSGTLGTNLEPGGGASIMGYTYVCGNQNLWDVPRGEANHFNLVSLDQMRWRLQSIGCATVTPNPNQPPTVSAGADYIIPRNTPFTLTATGSDPDGDQLTYTWDQFDYNDNRNALGSIQGTQGLAAIDDPEAPLFRPRPPRTAPSRTFPDVRYILANHNQPHDLIGEALPNVGRDLHFAVTARDQRPTGGTFATDNVTLTVVPNAGPFTVTVQNDNPSLWVIGQTVAVTWAVNGTDQAPINATQVRLTLSTDGGQSFSTVLAASIANNGTTTLTVPNLPTTRARVRVEALGNIFFDINDADFSLAPCAPVASQTLPVDALTAAAGDAALNLGQNLYSLTELTGPNQVTGTINATNPTSTLTTLQNGNCIGYSNVTYYQAHTFVPSVTDVYTIDTPVGFGNMVLRVYGGDTFQPGSPCQNLLTDNKTAGFLPRSVSTRLVAGLPYTLVVSSFSNSLPSNGAYRVTFTPQTSGGKIFAPMQNAGYENQYATINLASNLVVQLAPTADLRGLGSGTYAVYGLLVQRGYPTSNLIGRSLSNLQASLAATTLCGQLSDNTRSVTILPSVLTRAVPNQPGLVVKAFPNPVPGGATLQLELRSDLPQQVELQVTDALGRPVLKRSVMLTTTNLLDIPEARQWHGVYVLTVQTASGLYSRQKLVLE